MSSQFSVHLPNPRYEPDAKGLDLGVRIRPKIEGRDPYARDPYAEIVVDFPDGNRLAFFISRPQDALDLGRAIHEAGILLSHEILSADLGPLPTDPKGS